MSGQRDAGTIDAAVTALRREQVFVTKIEALKRRAGAAKKPKRGKAVPWKNLAIFGSLRAFHPNVSSLRICF